MNFDNFQRFRALMIASPIRRTRDFADFGALQLVSFFGISAELPNNKAMNGFACVFRDNLRVFFETSSLIKKNVISSGDTPRNYLNNFRFKKINKKN